VTALAAALAALLALAVLVAVRFRRRARRVEAAWREQHWELIVLRAAHGAQARLRSALAASRPAPSTLGDVAAHVSGMTFDEVAAATQGLTYEAGAPRLCSGASAELGDLPLEGSDGGDETLGRRDRIERDVAEPGVHAGHEPDRADQLGRDRQVGGRRGGLDDVHGSSPSVGRPPVGAGPVGGAAALDTPQADDPTVEETTGTGTGFSVPQVQVDTPPGDGEAFAPSPGEGTERLMPPAQGWGCTCGAWGRLRAGASPKEIVDFEQLRENHDAVCPSGGAW
jgi:hypothetical protein